MGDPLKKSSSKPPNGLAFQRERLIVLLLLGGLLKIVCVLRSDMNDCFFYEHTSTRTPPDWSTLHR